LNIRGTEVNSSESKEPSWQLWEDLPPEKEDELIEKMAQTIVKRKLGLMAQMILESLGPLTRIGAELGMTILGPYLEFFGVEKVTALFRKRENVKRLMDRIEELEEEHKSKKRTKAKR
jgi:hypothetical protein